MGLSPSVSLAVNDDDIAPGLSCAASDLLWEHRKSRLKALYGPETGEYTTHDRSVGRRVMERMESPASLDEEIPAPKTPESRSGGTMLIHHHNDTEIAGSCVA